jgi:hypothetical protein
MVNYFTTYILSGLSSVELEAERRTGEDLERKRPWPNYATALRIFWIG